MNPNISHFVGDRYAHRQPTYCTFLALLNTGLLNAGRAAFLKLLNAFGNTLGLNTLPSDCRTEPITAG